MQHHFLALDASNLAYSQNYTINIDKKAHDTERSFACDI